ncbi:MAG: glycine zipper 2TM domain-containing protein [Colwellia sp.]
MRNLSIPIFLFFTLMLSMGASADYDRNKAVPVEKVLFGKVLSVRHITEKEIIEDKNKGWKVFGGALIGGAIGNQFGDGSGRDVATILGAILGGSIANNKNPQYRQKIIHLIELMIKTDQGAEFMVVQDLDPKMAFQHNDAIRMIYLANGSVRIDKQM